MALGDEFIVVEPRHGEVGALSIDQCIAQREYRRWTGNGQYGRSQHRSTLDDLMHEFCEERHRQREVVLCSVDQDQSVAT